MDESDYLDVVPLERRITDHEGAIPEDDPLRGMAISGEDCLVCGRVASEHRENRSVPREDHDEAELRDLVERLPAVGREALGPVLLGSEDTRREAIHMFAGHRDDWARPDLEVMCGLLDLRDSERRVAARLIDEAGRGESQES